MTKQLTYSEKLRNPKWQKKRLEVLQRDLFTCQMCRCTENELHVHHLSYEKGKEPWEYEMDNYKTYCWRCHFLVEDLKNNGVVSRAKFSQSAQENHLIAYIRLQDELRHMGVAIYKVNVSARTFQCIAALADDIINEMHELTKQ